MVLLQRFKDRIKTKQLQVAHYSCVHSMLTGIIFPTWSRKCIFPPVVMTTELVMLAVLQLESLPYCLSKIMPHTYYLQRGWVSSVRFVFLRLLWLQQFSCEALLSHYLFLPSFPTSLVALASLFYNFFIVWAVVLIVQMIVVSVSFSFFHQQLLFWAGLNESGINFGINISSHTCEELACKCMESVLRLISTKP